MAVKEGTIIKVNEYEEPPTVLMQFENGEVAEYTITDLVGMFVTHDMHENKTQSQDYDRDRR